MKERVFTFTQDEITKYRICLIDSLKNKVPYTMALKRDVFRKYYSDNFLALNVHSYVGIIDEHEDWYVHATRDVKGILDRGVIRAAGDDDLTVGKAVYTFPLMSGRLFGYEDLDFLLFKTDQKHVHLVRAEDSNCVIGECDFLEDIKVNNPVVMNYEQICELQQNRWNELKDDPKKFNQNLFKYYGLNGNFDFVTLEDLPNFIYKYCVECQDYEENKQEDMALF